MTNLLSQISSHLLIGRHVRALNRNIQRRGYPEVDRLRGNVGRQEIECSARKLLVKTQPQLSYVDCRSLVVFLQSDRDVCIGGPGDAAIAVREIYARYGQADIVDNPLKFVRRDLVSYGS